MSKPTLYLMLGFPGAGKTTTAEIVSELTGAVKLSSDQLRVHMFKKPTFSQAEHDAVYGALDYLTELLLAKGMSVIYDANLNRYQHRQEKYDICQRAQADALVLWITTDKTLAKQRATEDAHTDPVRRIYGNLSPEIFERLAHEIEPPRADERLVTLDGRAVTLDMVRQALQGI